MIALINTVLLASLVVACLLVLDRHDRRHQEERAQHRAELAALLQRIQAPQAAVAEYHATVTPASGPANAMPMSDHEMAAAEDDLSPETRRLIAAMEAVENGHVPMTDFPDDL